MGIVNVTPDSFSDGGLYQALPAAVDHALKLADEGADILDVGGESTRPYAEVVDAAEEIRRVIPVIERICKQSRIPVSIDTSKAEVAARAIDVGAQIINDVTGLEGDPEMIALAVQSQVGVCAMHMQGRPQTMQDCPQYKNVVGDIEAYLKQRRDHLRTAGLETQRICLDPGIGFGKTHQHNFTLMAQCGTFHRLGCPLLVGHSRKGFLAKVLGDKETDRTFATVGAALALARQGIQVIRVHDVRPVKDALLLFEATGGVDGCERQLDQP
ncbi:MAG: dihydropteroate synthase [Planctomycetaceae bacterium]|nr:dihydropteroate synthase [Planctomycetaceae bacterium]